MKKLFIGCLLVNALFLSGCTELMEIAVRNLEDSQQTLCDVDAAYIAGQNAKKGTSEMKPDYGHGCKNAAQMQSAYQAGYVISEDSTRK